MTAFLDNLDDLLAEVNPILGEDPGERVALSVEPWGLSAVWLQSPEGDILSRLQLDEEIPEADLEFGRRFIHEQLGDAAVDCAVLPGTDGRCRVVAWRHLSRRGPIWIGCLVDTAQGEELTCGCTKDGPAPAADVPKIPAWLGGLLSGVIFRQQQELLKLQTRVDHLKVEVAAMKASHTEAVNAAVEEREERLREQEEHFRQIETILHKAADGILTVDHQGIVRSLNEAAERILGYAPNEIVGKHIDTLAGDNGEERETGLFNRLVCRRGSCERNCLECPGHTEEVVVLRSDRKPITVELAVSEVMIGTTQLYTVIFRDITRRKESEEELRRLHLMLQLILNSAGEGIIGLDARGNILWVNPTAASLLGWNPDELIGKPMHETIHKDVDGSPLPSPCPVCHGDSSVVASNPLDNHLFWRKNGTHFPVTFTSRPMHDGEHLAGRVVTFTDVSERRQLEAQLRQAQKLESIGQLAAGIAHEINTPTQYIGDNIRFIQDSFHDLESLLQLCRGLAESDSETPSPDVLDAIRRAAEEADLDYLLEEIPSAISQSLEGVARVGKIVRSMKEFSHPGGDEKQAVDLNRALENTITVSRNEWKYVAELKTDLAEDLPPVQCLAGEINQVFLNLIVNAAHAIGDKLGESPKEKGTITVTSRRVEGAVEIRIADTGTGIPPENLEKIFDPFFTTKPVGKGTGQGLAIARNIIVNKHGGSIDVESTPGEGTTFIVRLPLDSEEASTGPKP
ncbi:hypothetical protein JCM19992_05050 [Thermostilla marina]